MRCVSLALIGVLCMGGCITQKAGARRGHIDVIAHRGASAYAPENTLAAFELAAEMGAHWFELDCTLSKDGEVIVIHDDTVDRTTSSTGRVRDLTLAQLKKLDAGSWFDQKFASERLPTLGQTLDLAQTRIGVYIEIKNMADDGKLMEDILKLAKETAPGTSEFKEQMMQRIEASASPNLELTRKVIQEVHARHMRRQVVIQSFSPIVCAIALTEAPDYRTELLAASNPKDPQQWETFLRWEKILEPHGFNIRKNDVLPDMIAERHSQGRSMAIWTVNEEAEMARLIRLRVDGIITDVPDICLAIARRLEN